MPRITVHIDSLVLKGFRHEDRHAIAAAVQEELTRVLAEPGTAAQIVQLGSIPRMQIGNVTVEPHAKSKEIGTSTGRAVGERLTK